MTKAKRPAIIDAGEALYGPAWQEKLAEALGVSSKTIWRWKNGALVPDGVWLDIAKLMEEHSGELKSKGAQLRKLYGP